MEQKLKDILKNIKPNPNHFPIIDKWNYKYVFAPNKSEIFLLLWHLCNERRYLQEYFNKYGIECKELEYPIWH